MDHSRCISTKPKQNDVFLCEEHSASYGAIDSNRKVIKVLLIGSVFILVVWEPLALGMSYVGYRESRIGGVAIALMLAVAPVVVGVLTFLHASARRHSRNFRRFYPALSSNENELQLFCRDPEFVNAVDSHRPASHAFVDRGTTQCSGGDDRVPCAKCGRMINAWGERCPNCKTAIER